MNKTFSIIFLLAYLPFVMALAVETESVGMADVFYGITGLMMFVSGTALSVNILRNGK